MIKQLKGGYTSNMHLTEELENLRYLLHCNARTFVLADEFLNTQAPRRIADTPRLRNIYYRWWESFIERLVRQQHRIITRITELENNSDLKSLQDRKMNREARLQEILPKLARFTGTR